MNQAFIDGQNLYMNTHNNGWDIDLIKFRVYLKEKYKVEKAYYFLGAVNDNNQGLYELIQSAGFILIFREFNQEMISKKKGNVDTDIVFTMLSKIIDKDKFDKIVLVSGDGDYFKTMKYLIEKGRFCKLLAPNRHSTSTLYHPFTPKYVSYLDAVGTEEKNYTKKEAQIKNGFFLGISPFELPASEYILIISNLY